MTRVVNIKSGQPYDIYIGRGKDPKTGRTGKWGNPFHIGDNYNGRVLSRHTCLEVYRDWLEASDAGVRLMEDIWQLHGKRLGCWCKPELCHGDILAEHADMWPPITDFHEQGHEFLSNFYGGAFSLEHDFQAAKATTKEDHWFVHNSPTPKEAKRRGRMIKCREDWEGDKFDVMLRLLEKKFSDHALRRKLLDTGYSELIEGNYWHDNTWGSCTCAKCGNVGENLLGQMLMDVRRRIRLGELK